MNMRRNTQGEGLCFGAQEVANKFGISKLTLFEWEKKGKISKVPRDWRGWRVYRKEHLEQVKKIISDKKRRAME